MSRPVLPPESDVTPTFRFTGQKPSEATETTDAFVSIFCVSRADNTRDVPGYQ